MIQTKPPERVASDTSAITIFLAGSIEMDTAEKWQDKTVEALKDLELLHIYNPRRDSWNSEWKQAADNPNFKEQVLWEMDYLDKADIKAFYFDPKTKSPVTMLELGLCLKHARSLYIENLMDGKEKENRVIVCCPEGFWRKGNVQLASEKYRGLRINEDFESFIKSIRSDYDALLTSRALQFARKAHDGQVRKFSGIPYIMHPIHVAGQAQHWNLPGWVIAAAYLHDVVEDCGISVEGIEKVFGKQIATLVSELTNPSKDSKAPRDERKQMDRDHIAAASKEAKTVKLIDRIHNVSDMANGDAKFAVKYCKESRDLLEVIKDAHPELALKLEETISNTERICLDKIAKE